MRDTSRDKKDFLKSCLGRAPLVWKALAGVPAVRNFANRAILTRAIMEVPTRPNPLCCGWDYTTWEGLTNTRWAGRHLEPKPQPSDLPSPDKVAELLFRRQGGLIESEKSTLLFPYFAQWFTDGFLAADPVDRRRTHSNHQIDLCQLYGIHPETTKLIRDSAGGRLKYQLIDGAEFPPFLLKEDGSVKAEFRRPRRSFNDYFNIGLQSMQVTKREDGDPRLECDLDVVQSPPVHLSHNELRLSDSATKPEFGKWKASWFAMANDRANSTPAFVMMNVLMLREHNRVARLLEAANPGWDDERVFQTTRNVLIVIVLKIVLEEYINHIAPYHFKLFVDPPSFWPSRFNPVKWRWTNWMTLEFNLLYRWHSTIPDALYLGNRSVPGNEALWNTQLIIDEGLAQMFNYTSAQRSGRIGPRNTAAWLTGMVEPQSIQMGRDAKLAPYNDYRKLLGMPEVTEFNQITGDEGVQNALREVYGTVDRIEYYTGMFSEDLRPKSALAPMVGTMVAMDAFSQALINPLLHERIWKRETFGDPGWDLVQQDQSIAALVQRNTPEFSGNYDISMTRKDWSR